MRRPVSADTGLFRTFARHRRLSRGFAIQFEPRCAQRMPLDLRGLVAGTDHLGEEVDVVVRLVPPSHAGSRAIFLKTLVCDT